MTEGAGAGPAGGKKKSRKSAEKNAARCRPLAAPKEPTFYIGGGNGNSLVFSALNDLGWRRITDKYNDQYKLKWVECKSQINYAGFREGEQLVNRIPNCQLLTNKLGLLNSLQRYERVQNAVNAGKYSRIRSKDFLPETYRIDDAADRKTFLETYEDGELWICKPTGMNQGKGIFLVRELEEFKKTLDERDEKKHKSHRPAMDRIVQRYIHDPMLLEGRKFDIRAYMVIASTMPFLILYHKGYVRLCLQEYNTKNENLTAHLTNQFIQKKDADYQAAKETTVWSMDKLNDYVNENVAEENGLEQDWVYNGLTSRMKQIMTYCFKAVQHKLKYKLGYFDLYGLDFMVDQNMKVWLIEINVNPCLSTNCEALKEIVPSVVRESLYLSIECFEKQKRNKPLMPLESIQNCQLLYSESSKSYKSQNRGPGVTAATATSSAKATGSQAAGASPPRSPSPRARSLSPVQRNRSLSPVKDTTANNNNNNVLSATLPTNFSINSAAAAVPFHIPGGNPPPPTFRPSVPHPPSYAGEMPERAMTPRGTPIHQPPTSARSSLPRINSAGAAPSPRVTSASQEAIKFRLTHTMAMRRKSSPAPPSGEPKPRAEKPERQTLALRTISAKYSTAEFMDKSAALSPPIPAGAQARRPSVKTSVNLTGFKHPKSPSNLGSSSPHSISAALVPSIGANTQAAGAGGNRPGVSTVLLTPTNSTHVTQATADLNRSAARTPRSSPRPGHRAITPRQLSAAGRSTPRGQATTAADDDGPVSATIATTPATTTTYSGSTTTTTAPTPAKVPRPKSVSIAQQTDISPTEPTHSENKQDSPTSNLPKPLKLSERGS